MELKPCPKCGNKNLNANILFRDEPYQYSYGVLCEKCRFYMEYNPNIHIENKQGGLPLILMILPGIVIKKGRQTWNDIKPRKIKKYNKYVVNGGNLTIKC